MHVCMYVCMHARNCMCVYVCIVMCICVSICIYIYICMCVCMFKQTDGQVSMFCGPRPSRAAEHEQRMQRLAALRCKRPGSLSEGLQALRSFKGFGVGFRVRRFAL